MAGTYNFTSLRGEQCGAAFAHRLLVEGDGDLRVEAIVNKVSWSAEKKPAHGVEITDTRTCQCAQGGRIAAAH